MEKAIFIKRSFREFMRKMEEEPFNNVRNYVQSCALSPLGQYSYGLLQQPLIESNLGYLFFLGFSVAPK